MTDQDGEPSSPVRDAVRVLRIQIRPHFGTRSLSGSDSVITVLVRYGVEWRMETFLEPEHEAVRHVWHAG